MTNGEGFLKKRRRPKKNFRLRTAALIPYSNMNLDIHLVVNVTVYIVIIQEILGIK